MRTTINLDPDVIAAADELRRSHGLGISEAVNTLARRGLTMASTHTATPFVQRTRPSDFLQSIDNTADVLDFIDELDGPST